MSHNHFYTVFDFAHLPGKRPEQDTRSPFQIDRDRVLFSTPFRQLQSKTQVFQSGEYDFYRTRLTHTIEVARIARSITEFLNASSPRLRPNFFIDPDLVEAVGLAHDLGHPPFGHIGERKLNALMRKADGFEGNAQTLRILTQLIYARADRPSGMKPTRAFLDGVLKYKCTHAEASAQLGTAPEHHFLYNEQSRFRDFVFEGMDSPLDASQWNALKSIECQIMDWADDTAYSLHDIVDGVKARFITPDALILWGERNDHALSAFQKRELEAVIAAIRSEGYEPRTGQHVGQFIRACSLEPCDSPAAHLSNRHRFALKVEPKVRELCRLHKAIAVDLIFKSPPLQQIEFKGGFLLQQLFSAFSEHLLGLADQPLNILPAPYANWIRPDDPPAQKLRLLCDYLSALTDAQAVRAYKRLFQPDFASLADLG